MLLLPALVSIQVLTTYTLGHAPAIEHVAQHCIVHPSVLMMKGVNKVIQIV